MGEKSISVAGKKMRVKLTNTNAKFKIIINFCFGFAATAFEPRTECELPLDLDYLIVFCQSSDVNSFSLALSIIAVLFSK